MWRAARIAVLSILLAAVAFHAVLDRRATQSWRTPLWVGVFPVAGDESPVTAAYVAGLTAADVEPVARFMQREAAAHGGPAMPVRVALHAGAHPPPPARGDSHGALANVLWSLRLRWYAWRRMQAIDGARPRVRLFVIYHDPARTVKVPHSVGLQKGLLGVVHAFASRNEHGGNQVVIAHELLHTLGATDKYGPDGLPSYPDGYAEPAREPRLPQQRAEIMGGRIPVAADRAEMPAGLAQTVIGARTAREIGWAAR